MITQISDTEYHVKSRGQDMTLRRSRLGWELTVVNAQVRAYNRGFAPSKIFDSLADIERQYKSWKGISALAQLAQEESKLN